MTELLLWKPRTLTVFPLKFLRGITFIWILRVTFITGLNIQWN